MESDGGGRVAGVGKAVAPGADPTPTVRARPPREEPVPVDRPQTTNEEIGRVPGCGAS